jgi:hypothetical protein
VIMFANNPIYRWQNHGEFNMVFNALLNWNDMGQSASEIPAAGQDHAPLVLQPHIDLVPAGM